MSKLKNKLWVIYYRLKFKDAYATKMKSLGLFSDYLNEQNNSTVGIGRNYNAAGDQIRGWYRATHCSRPNTHPLIARYSK